MINGDHISICSMVVYSLCNQHNLIPVIASLFFLAKLCFQQLKFNVLLKIMSNLTKPATLESMKSISEESRDLHLPNMPGTGMDLTICIDSLEKEIQSHKIGMPFPKRNSVPIVNYKRKGSTITVDAKNSVLFLMIPNQQLALHIEGFVLSKAYPFVCFVVAIISMVIDFFVEREDNPVLDNMLDVIGWGISLLLTTTYILCLNVQIIKLVSRTFDFWYKMINWILCIVATFVIETQVDQPIFVRILQSITQFLIGFWIFMTDASYISIKHKIWIESVAALICIFFAIYSYINNKDIFYNPFSSPHTDVSIKGIQVSGFLNVALFTLKANFADFYFNFIINNKPKEQEKDPKLNEKQSNVMMARSTSIVERPYFKWKNVP